MITLSLVNYLRMLKGGFLVDQVKPGLEDMQFTRLIDLIYLEYLNLRKIISQCETYNFILVIVNYLIKIVYYKPMKVTIDILGLVKVILNIIVHYNKIIKSIVIDQGLFFILKFWFCLYYYLSIKRKLYIAFYL